MVRYYETTIRIANHEESSMSKKVELLAPYVQEALKCKADPIYFIENYVKNPMFNNEPIRLRKRQKEIIKSILNSHNIIINGSRQTGKTTVIVLFSLWLTLFFPKYTVFFMSKKGESTADLLREFELYYDTVPNWLKPTMVKNNTFTKEFSNGSRIKGVTVAKGKAEEAGRGMKGGFIFIDEIAFFEADISKIYTALVPTTSYVFKKYEELQYPYGMALVSTPNGTTGTGEFFYTMWVKALKGEVDLVPIRYHWSDVLEYLHDPEWIDSIKRKFADEREFNQEYELVFLGSRFAFFPDSVIEKLQKFDYPVKQSIKLSYGKLDIYDEIDPDSFYLIGVDTASGFAGDYSAIIITDYESGLPIAEYRAKVTVEEFKQDILRLPELLGLKNFIFIPENNGIGSSVSQWLATTKYSKNLYYTIRKDGKGRITKKVPGLSTDSKTRPLMLETLYETVSENAELIKPKVLKLELVSLEKRGQRVEAPDPMHDDTVFAYAFTLYVRNYGELRHVPLNRKEKLRSYHRTLLATQQLAKLKERAEYETVFEYSPTNFMSGL